MSVRRAPSPPSSLPLKHRVPNGPARFVGRAEESQLLARRVASEPLVIVVGPGGLGKTSLVVHTMRALLEGGVEEALYLAVEPDEPVEQVRHRILHALVRAAGESAPRRAVDDDPEAVVAASIDLAEMTGRHVLLDDVHYAETGEMEQLLVQLASYARRSRWVATSRAAVRLPALVPNQLELAKMSEAELGELGRMLAPDAEPDALRRAIRGAGGSPWLLQQWAAVGERGLSFGRDELLATLDLDSSELLQALAVLHGSFPPAVLSSFLEVPDEVRIEALERRGTIQRRAGGLTVHDVVRGHLFGSRQHAAEERAWMARAAQGLSSTTHDEALLESMRLFAQLGRREDVRTLLTTHGDRLLVRGYAPALWQIVVHLGDPTLKRFRMRCAAELGNPTALAQVESPAEPDAGERLAWAHTLYAQGDLSAAGREAYAAASEAAGAGDRHEAVEGTILAARCHWEQGRLASADAALASLDATPSALVVRVAAARAVVWALRGQPGPADDALAELRETPPGDEADEAAHDLADAFYVLGRTDTAGELLDRVLSTRRGGRASLLRARQAMVTRARLLVDRGELEDAAELVQSMRPFARPPSVLRPAVLELEALTDLIAGRTEGLADRIEAVAAAAAPIDAGCVLRARCMAIELGLLLGARPSTDVPDTIDRLELHDVALSKRLATAHAGNFVVGDDDAEHTHPRHRVLAALVASTDALVAHRPADAAELARTGARLARKHTLLVLEAMLLRAEGDALAVAGAAGELEATTAFLREAAGSIGSRRFLLDAELWLAPDDPAQLGRIAESFHVSPAAARRARSLLGGSPPLDEVDAMVVRALEARRGGAEASVVCGPADEWAGSWGLDDRTQTVWLPECRTVDLSKKPLLWRVLGTLADRAGRATKEQLVLGAWQEREYHPGRHDARLHVSARKLRELIEDEPAGPRRLVTTEDGYRLGGTVRRLRATGR